ncbi:ras-related GTP-binding protein-like protein C [Westerdykella ornata]|uniref:GTP-binding protein n=1 Tax=Westerdykella ornata TaxID=318751 RepID=A0A6A6JL54_WESOR|nr:ras-related GTP-binding protein-like protein C [Westerdykella ornata]KAF2277222.1 ras-related GTP-binding protein-like protein C [Westerdykella ornata]
MRYLQELPDADIPHTEMPPRYHTGRLPNSKAGDDKPRLLLMGQPRSGKSSISSVVFHKLPPSETLYLETTTRIKKESMHSFMDFQVWDLPGHVDYFDPSFHVDHIFEEIGALIWVIDAQDEYLEAIMQLNKTILNLQHSYPSINVEVFVHKVDGLSDDYKADTFRDIIQRVTDELSDHGYENAPVSFYQTSIYDHSIFEAFSKVIQKLIPQLPTLEALLDSLCQSCRIEKAYLFDIMSKIYIAADTSPTDGGSYEIASDYIDVVIDVSEIYGWDRTLALEVEEEEIRGESGCNDAESLITMERKGNHYLYLREINKYLALICLMGDDSPAEKKAVIDYNVGVFQTALKQVFPRAEREPPGHHHRYEGVEFGHDEPAAVGVGR